MGSMCVGLRGCENNLAFIAGFCSGYVIMLIVGHQQQSLEWHVKCVLFDSMVRHTLVVFSLGVDSLICDALYNNCFVMLCIITVL